MPKTLFKGAAIAAALTFSAAPAFAVCNLAVPFASGSAAISAEAQQVLRTLAVNNPAATYSMTGHTDVTGSASANQRLSQRRIDAVRAFLEGNGGASMTLTGSDAVASTQPAGAALAANRRVEINVPDCDPTIFAQSSVIATTTSVATGTNTGGAAFSGLGGGTAAAAAIGLLLVVAAASSNGT